jgi:hypothetical protein
VVRSGRGRSGASRLGCLLQILVLAGVVYAGVLAGQDALNYYRLKDAMKNEARFASIRSDAEIRKRLRAFTDSVELPAAAKEINVVREGNAIRIWSEYDQEFKLPFKYSKVVHLRPSAEKSF